MQSEKPLNGAAGWFHTSNTQLDWNEKKAREEWSHKTVAYIAGMGSFSTAGSFVTAKGFAGKFSGMITDGPRF